MEGSHQAAPVDIDNPYIPLETSMRQELGRLSPLSSSCCIYRVPERLRRVNENAYTPQVVSIGPLHHGKKGLEAMEEHKKRYLQEFLCRTKVSLEDCIKKIRDREPRLRSCYAETNGFSSDEFVRIILVDAAFIVELLLKHNGRTPIKENDAIFKKPKIILDLETDMLLLENQLPIFILEDLFYLQQGTLPSDSDDRLSTFVTDLSLKFFTSRMTLMRDADQESILERLSSTKKVEHFLDLILRSLCQSEVELIPLGYVTTTTRVKTSVTPSLTPSVTELYQAGVEFKVGSMKNLFDIRFTNGICEIPKIRVDDDTEISLRSLLAFEQCHYMHNHICDYMTIMDGFVNNAIDVDLLVERGIIENIVGDRKELSALFNNLGLGICSDENFTFANLCEDLNRYYSSKRHKMMANLRHNYFNTPWRTLSVIAAVVLLILTLIQTACSIISVA
ncbi:PREDICTED: UPF0481 [Prunus dulcis]|uniref:PREDICTED: UPF0481 n=1 Tax=Prunus dulcis TaxID=3755 RepID=A0A5E4F6V9_PRUDU|nr:UPF0481 protein At3g47200-like [Prunus dulcis]KAI5355083.1 hypothetical protein L3X38_007978 [Prunus dulcis]VVA23814.1 PREDICTED: UPF0481 [Prunus dulcis]